VKALSQLAVIGLWDAQTGEARAMRIRQLSTPSWLSTRPKPVVERRAEPVRTAASVAGSSPVSPLKACIRGPFVFGL
jgi:hypothetical protein